MFDAEGSSETVVLTVMVKSAEPFAGGDGISKVTGMASIRVWRAMLLMRFLVEVPIGHRKRAVAALRAASGFMDMQKMSRPPEGLHGIDQDMKVTPSSFCTTLVPTGKSRRLVHDRGFDLGSRWSRRLRGALGKRAGRAD